MLMAFIYNNSPERDSVLLFPFHRWRNQAFEILRKFLTVNKDVEWPIWLLNLHNFPSSCLEKHRDYVRTGRSEYGTFRR